MSYQVGLSIGESFAELRVLPASSPGHRWYLSKKNVHEGLRDTLRELKKAHSSQLDSGVLSVVSSSVERALDRKQGQTPALIVNSGFESRLRVRNEMTTPLFSLSPKRMTPLVPNDYVFGISGRLAASGTELTPLKMEEMEFLKSKLELLKVKHLAVGLLHSGTNPEHENQIAKWFAEHGFHAFCSSSFKTSSGKGSFANHFQIDERESWLAAAEAAYAESVIEEEKTAVVSALNEGLGEVAKNWKIIFIGNESVRPWEELSSQRLRHGLERALSMASSTRHPELPTLHLGLDRFYFIPPREPSALPKVCLVSLRPTQLLEVGNWAFPSLSETSAGYEPGPMLFGKSQQLSVLDVLYVRDRLKSISGFENLINERSKPRILESLMILGNAAGLGVASPLDARKLAEDIETIVMEKISHCLIGLKGRVILQGAFATTFLPLLEQRRPDLGFQVATNSEWSEADSCLEVLK
jgi:hypothetical protein